MVWKSRICHVIAQYMCWGKIWRFLTKQMHKSPNALYIECLQTPNNLHSSYRILTIHKYPLYHTLSHIFKAKTPWPNLVSNQCDYPLQKYTLVHKHLCLWSTTPPPKSPSQGLDAFNVWVVSRLLTWKLEPIQVIRGMYHIKSATKITNR